MFAENLMWRFVDETGIEADVEVEIVEVMERIEVLETSRPSYVHHPSYPRHRLIRPTRFSSQADAAVYFGDCTVFLEEKTVHPLHSRIPHIYCTHQN